MSRDACNLFEFIQTRLGVTDETACHLCVAQALMDVAHEIKYLGNGDAATTMGGLEALGKVIMDSASEVASAVSDIAGGLESRD